jgi:hypothetical protein
MSEDEFDFAGQNPGELLAIDRRAQPFDYHARLHQKGYTKNSSPDAGELFKALATEFVPTVIVNLPPKVVERVKIVRRPGEILIDVCGVVFWGLLILSLYVLFVVFLGIVLPYNDLSDFVLKTQIQPGAHCTITATQIYSDSGDDGTSYYAYVYFTLRTPNGQDYDTTEYSTPSFNTSNDAQAYISSYRVHRTYPCWYNPANPAEAMFTVEIGAGDYAALFFSALGFLLCGLLPNALIIWALWRALWRRMRRA